MNEEIDKKLDKLTEKLLEDFSPEIPPFDFGPQIISKVNALSKESVVEYKPLISRRIWFILGISFGSIFFYLIFENIQAEYTLTSYLQIDLLPRFDSIVLPDYNISNVFMYAIVGLTFFIGIQILMLKNYFDRRLV